MHGDLQGVVELRGLGTDTNVVKKSVTLLVLEGSRLALRLEGLVDGSEVFVGGSSTGTLLLAHHVSVRSKHVYTSHASVQMMMVIKYKCSF